MKFFLPPCTVKIHDTAIVEHIKPGLALEAIPGFGVPPFWLLVVGAIAVLGTPRRRLNGTDELVGAVFQLPIGQRP